MKWMKWMRLPGVLGGGLGQEKVREREGVCEREGPSPRSTGTVFWGVVLASGGVQDSDASMDTYGKAYAIG